MARIFVDANVFLRFFTGDDTAQHGKAARLFKEAAGGRVLLVTGPPVLFEVAWTLRAAYKLPAETVLDVLSRLRGFSGLHMTDAELVDRALQLARERRVDYADAYIAASAEGNGADGVATFNSRDFRRLGSLLYGW